MENVKKEIDQYFDKTIKELHDMKMKAGTNIIKISEQSKSVIKFKDNFPKVIRSIISNNGITSQDEIAELISYANCIFIDRLREYAPRLPHDCIVWLYFQTTKPRDAIAREPGGISF